MYSNTNLAGLIYQNEQTKDTDRPWIYEDKTNDNTQPKRPVTSHQPQPKRQPIVNHFKQVVFTVAQLLVKQ